MTGINGGYGGQPPLNWKACHQKAIEGQSPSSGCSQLHPLLRFWAAPPSPEKFPLSPSPPLPRPLHTVGIAASWWQKPPVPQACLVFGGGIHCCSLGQMVTAPVSQPHGAVPCPVLILVVSQSGRWQVQQQKPWDYSRSLLSTQPLPLSVTQNTSLPSLFPHL